MMVWRNFWRGFSGCKLWAIVIADIRDREMYFSLFFSQNGEKLKNASNNVPESVAIGAVISWLPSESCPCNTVIGAAIRIPPLIEFGTPFTNLSASLVIPININTNATSSCNAIIA